jgi:ribosomal protein L29
MDFNEIKNKSEKDLQELLAEKREEWRELKFKSSEGQLKNVRAMRVAKKTIAKILTLLNKQKE